MNMKNSEHLHSQLEDLRRKLDRLVDDRSKLSDPSVIQVSREMDNVIIELQRMKNQRT